MVYGNEERKFCGIYGHQKEFELVLESFPQHEKDWLKNENISLNIYVLFLIL